MLRGNGDKLPKRVTIQVSFKLQFLSKAKLRKECYVIGREI